MVNHSVKLSSWILVLCLCLGYAWGQGGGYKLTEATMEHYPEDSVQLYRTTYRLTLSGTGKVKAILSIRVEDWTLEFDQLEKKLRMKASQPLNIVVNCMENRRAKRTEWMLTAWFGPPDNSTNLFVIGKDKMKNGHGDLPDVEVTLLSKGERVTVKGELAGQ
jgi:hypothetical protein